MSASGPPPPADRSGAGSALAAIGVAAVAMVCCAGPALLAAGVLGAVGGVLSSPWVIAAAALIAVASVLRHRRRSGRVACRLPDPAADPTAGTDDARR